MNIIPFFIYLSLMYTNTLIPTANAGTDISEFVTSCNNQNIIISVDGSTSMNAAPGVCDIGECSDATKYCTTSDGEVTSEACTSLSECDEIKVCVGGENDNLDCSTDSTVCGSGGSCKFPGECLSSYSYQSYCEAAGEEWTPVYMFNTENECEAFYGTSNNYWYDLSLEFDWSSNSADLAILNGNNANAEMIFNPLSSTGVHQYEVYLTVNNEFESDTDTLLINLDPQLPCAVSGNDIYICRACGDENSTLYNSDYATNILSNIQLDASSSYSYAGDNFSYSWTAPDGFALSDANISNPTITIDYDIARNAVNIFTLEVTDNDDVANLVSTVDTLVLYMNPSKPDAPKVEVYPENDKITLNWEKNSSIASVDSLTGYTDFEGYRVYKSIDGGKTWGSADDRIFYNGAHVGWRHKAQSDLSEEQDSYFCIKGIDSSVIGENLLYKSWEACVDADGDGLGSGSSASNCCIDELVRGSSVSNLDSYAPWINLGDDGGLKFSYVDTSVYNGKEYTYAVVAYDIGLQSYSNEASLTGDGICKLCDSVSPDIINTEENCCIFNGGAWVGGDGGECQDSCSGDGHTWTPTYESIQTWPEINPDQFTYDGTNGFQSLESDLIESINMVTVIPAFYAENVDNISNFIDESDFGIPAEDKFMGRDSATVGNGGVYFQIINPYDITDKRYQFEINADYAGSDVEIFEGYKTENPKLYAWEINLDTSAVSLDYSITSEDQLIHDEKCELLNLPGSIVAGECSRWTKICEGGTKDGKECTYNEDYCTNGICIDSEVNYLENYYSCVCDDILADLSGASGSIDGLASSYNDWLFGGDTIFYPIYEIEDFPVKYLYQDGYDENYTEFMDGLKFIFNNNVEKVEDLDNGEVNVNTLQSYDSEGLKTDLSRYINIKLEYGNGGNVFDNKPSYSYRIEFSDTPKHSSYDVTPSSGCSGQPNTLLPFKIINTTTNKEVGVNHVDKGGFYDESGAFNAYGVCVENGNPCTPSQYCNVNECIDLKGYGDCTWGKNERTSFTQDIIHVGLTARETPEYTFDLKVDYNIYSLYSKGIDPSEVNPWYFGYAYNTGDVVKYNDMFWRAISTPDPVVSPVEWVDDGDNNNINSWLPIYPWDDGDYIIVEPTRWYVDGDTWIADLSKLGESSNTTSHQLKKISVVPNPYIVNSDYDETRTSRRLWFNHLPNKCRITIYTISGERVASILHNDDDLSGKESWDLRSQGGDLVAPGLYIYTVESEGVECYYLDSDGNIVDADEDPPLTSVCSDTNNMRYIKHISKFAIVR